jgi:hypothetical protein
MNHGKSQLRIGPLELIFAIAVVGLTVFAFLRLGPLEGLCTAIVGVGAAYVMSALWNPPESKPPLPDPADQKDPVAWAVEHNEHRYDPGYWTGGRLHPVLRAGRSNRYGLYLLFGSFITLGVGAFAASAGMGGMVTYLLFVVISAAELAAGWALLRRERR